MIRHEPIDSDSECGAGQTGMDAVHVFPQSSHEDIRHICKWLKNQEPWQRDMTPTCRDMGALGKLETGSHLT